VHGERALSAWTEAQGERKERRGEKGGIDAKKL
jgi:hypothetical protein